jgi:hypothetical protein
MKSLDDKHERYLKNPLSIRLGGLAANLARISSLARRDTSNAAIEAMFEESLYFVEWTAAEAEPEVAAELVDIQLMLGLWQRVWPETQNSKMQRTLLSVQAKKWADQVLDYSGLLTLRLPNAPLLFILNAARRHLHIGHVAVEIDYNAEAEHAQPLACIFWDRLPNLLVDVVD